MESNYKKHKCKDCIYIYNPDLGDPSQGINPGTLFQDLPSSWVCPICKAHKNRFKSIN